VTVKREDFQPTKTDALRGAFHTLAHCTDERKRLKVAQAFPSSSSAAAVMFGLMI
jgi:threonine dehydratase